MFSSTLLRGASRDINNRLSGLPRLGPLQIVEKYVISGQAIDLSPRTGVTPVPLHTHVDGSIDPHMKFLTLETGEIMIYDRTTDNIIVLSPSLRSYLSTFS